MTMPLDDAVPSPCVSICRMDATLGPDADRRVGGLCVGCLRTIDEIIEWGSASDARKHEILAAIAQRR